jgi:hypothetical protein
MFHNSMMLLEAMGKGKGGDPKDGFLVFMHGTLVCLRFSTWANANADRADRHPKTEP